MSAPHPGSSSKPNSQMFASIPPHSLVAFGLFLRLPGYAEVLLKERKRAQCLLRLVLGVTDDGQGGENGISCFLYLSVVLGSLDCLYFTGNIMIRAQDVKKSHNICHIVSVTHNVFI